MEEADGVFVLLGDDVWLPVFESVCDCEGDPVRLAVCVWLLVTDIVEEADGVCVNDGEPEVEGVCVDDTVPVEDCVGEKLAVGLKDVVWV